MPRRHRTGASAASKLARVEELLVASSGDDAFESAYALAAAHLHAREAGRAPPSSPRELGSSLAAARRAWPWLEARAPADLPPDVTRRALDVLGAALAAPDGLDALFEVLAPRVGKGDKGQYFTPRPVVAFVLAALAPRDGERVLDPACGSGAFVAGARDLADVDARGTDVDPRAVRVARLLAAAAGRDPRAVVRADALARARPASSFDVIATNPPFAGAVDATGFELAALGRRVERDALFTERCVALLRPGGRLGIVLPYNKVASRAFAPFRAWLLARARVLSVVSLPQETFLPHTQQRAVCLFAQKRRAGAAPRDDEPILFVASERAGKTTAGEPIPRQSGKGWCATAHDLDEALAVLRPFLAGEGFAS